MKIDYKEREVTIENGVIGTDSYWTVTLSKNDKDIIISIEDYGGGSSFWLPYGEFKEAYEALDKML